MMELMYSPFFGMTLTIVAYLLAMNIQKKVNHVLCNGMILTVLIIIAILELCNIPYDAYHEGGNIINMMLGPATTCMAVSIYAKKDLLKKHWLPVLAGCLVGAVVSIGSILVMCKLFSLDAAMTASMLPKSVTTAIAKALSESHGGIPSITVAAVIFTGIGGNLMAPVLIKLFRIKDPMAAGLGIGACSHAAGTAKAVEIGETEGAMSSLAIGICGIMTAVLALGFDFLITLV